MRFSDLQRAIPDVSQKMLIQQLRGLERDGVISRKVYPEVPPKVEYRLTEIGRGLGPVFGQRRRSPKLTSGGDYSFGGVSN
jgi:DNA-binding HxlR family transcriptional regulator